MRCVVLWDIESVPFRFNCLVKKYILNLGFNYYLDPKYIGLSKQNLRLSRIKKKRGFEIVVSDDISKDSADRLLKSKAKLHKDRTVILVSNDLKFAKELLKKHKVILFYINKDIPVDELNIQCIHMFNNFKETHDV